MTEAQLHKAFQKHGIEKVDAHGELFDPNHHSAVFEMPTEHDDHKPGHIGQVIKSGFKIADRTLRPAEVGVFKK